jgi:hypothetical protein
MPNNIYEHPLTPEQAYSFTKSTLDDLIKERSNYEKLIKRASELYLKLSINQQLFTKRGRRIQHIVRISQGRIRKLESGIKDLQEILHDYDRK